MPPTSHLLRALRVPLLILTPLLAVPSCAICTLPTTDHASTPLFDGATLSNWTPRAGSAHFRVEDNTITGETRPNSPNTFLCTTRDYADFILELDVLVHPELNSGVQIRSRLTPEGLVAGYQVEIDPTPRGYSGGIYEENGREWLAKPTPEQALNTPFKPGEWNHYRIVARGPRVRTWINGVPVADLTDDAARSGFIALQVHGVGSREDPLQIRWRNIRIQELD